MRHRLIRAIADIAPGPDALPEPGVIIPKAVIERISKLFKADEIKLQIDDSTIAARADNSTLTAKLIDATFPSYQRVIPAAADAVAEIERAATLAALGRMAAIAKKEWPTLTLGWNGSGGARLTMAGGEIAEDFIAAATTGEAEIGLAIRLFHELVNAIDAKTLRLGIISKTDPMLINPAGDGNLLAILMPCHDRVT